MTNRVNFRTCSSKNHRFYGSVYPQNEVPSDLFAKPNTPQCFYKMCADCRVYTGKSRKRLRDKKDNQLCSTNSCYNIPTEGKKTCNICRQRNREEYLKSRDHYLDLMYIKIVEMGYCCEICKKIFIKNNNSGFMIVDTLINVTKDMIEFSNLEFDHLPEKEQLLKYGYFYGKKVKGVSKIIDPDKRFYESKKCQLICLFCHTKETERREKENNVIRGSNIRHYNYITALKKEIGCCESCRVQVDTNNLSYYEFDHINPTTKEGKISKLIHGSLERLKQELKKCRLLCRFCHRVHTTNQKRRKINN